MRTFKATCATLVLALSLTATTAFADTTPGDGHTPGSPSPQMDAPTQPTETTLISGTSTDGDEAVIADILWALTTIY